MGRKLWVLDVDRFFPATGDRTWLEWVIQRDAVGVPFIVTDEGKRLNLGDVIITQPTGDRVGLTLAEFDAAHKIGEWPNIRMIEVR